MSTLAEFGRRVHRREDAALLTGKGRYVADHIRPGMAAMHVIRSTVAHGRIQQIDFGDIARDRTCLGYFCARDLPRAIGPLPAMDLTDNSAPIHQQVLARDIVRFVGEPVAVVVANDSYVAQDLAQRVHVQYEPLAAVMDVQAGSGADAPLLYPTLDTNVVHQTTQLVGDPDQAFAQAVTVVEETFRFQRVIGSPMEPRGAVAYHEPGTGRFVLCSSTQIPQIVRKELARMTGIEPQRLRVIAPQVGGGFGAKEAVYPEEALLLLALERFGRAVYWLEDRQESFSATVHGREETIHVKAAVDADGIITAIEADCLADIGAAYSLFGNTPGAAVATIRGPYRIPHFRSRARSVTTNKTPLNVYRGAGHPQAVLAMERMMDLAAAAAGLDRVELRRRNLLQPDAFPVDRGVSYPGCGRVVFDSGNFPALLRSTLHAIDHAGFAARRSQAPEGVLLGFGLSFVVEMTGGGGAEPARLRLLPDGRLQLLSGITPIGQGSETALLQVLSDHLGVPSRQIEFRAGDTDDSPDAPGTFASRGMTMGGNAACRAADAFIRQARELVAELYGTGFEQVEWSRGAFTLCDRRQDPITLEALVKTALARGVALHTRLDRTAQFEDPGVGFASACHATVLEVDRGTGVIRVLDYAVTHDCGRVTNPLLVDGQIMGGVLQGLGGCLFEEIRFDTTGSPLTHSYMDYVLPTAATAPRFILRHIETPSPLNPLGMKGAGEAGCSGALGAIVTGIADALGPGVKLPGGSGPFTPAVIRGLLRNADDGGAFAC
jgi:carbon-monoxide dehydrogenase large subunit